MFSSTGGTHTIKLSILAMAAIAKDDLLYTAISKIFSMIGKIVR